MLSICDFPIKILGADNEIISKYDKLFALFKSNILFEDKKYLLKIEVQDKNEIKIPDCDYELSPFCFYQDYKSLKVWNQYSKTGYVEINNPWNKAKIIETVHTTDILRLNLLQIAFSSFLYFNKGIFMHGAVVSYKDNGIIFTASPGGGKSTQAQLWQKLYQAQILNGDKAMIRLKNDCCMVYGSPWSGSSKYKINKGVPLKAIISLQKGDNNEIFRVTNHQMLQEIGTHIYYPYWDKELLNISMDTLDEILYKVPVYILKCTPDERATDLTKYTIFKE